MSFKYNPSELVDVANEQQINSRITETPLEPQRGSMDTGVIYMADVANDSRFVQANFQEPLTRYAVAGWDKTDLYAELQTVAPELPVSRRFEYKAWVNAEAFYYDADDTRAMGADFKRVEYTSSKVLGKTINRGLVVRLDLDEVAQQPNWEEFYTGMLMRRIQRNVLVRFYTLVAATATSTSLTWTPGLSVDPDGDLATALLAARNASGVSPNRVVYGETGWNKRFNAYRADANTARFYNSQIQPADLAKTMMVDSLIVSKSRYQSTASAKTETVGSNFFAFVVNDPSVEDPSNFKRFVTPTLTGGPVRMFRTQVTDKLVDLGIEYYDLLAATYTGGVRQGAIA